jgi:hypothetical protein
MAGRLRVLTAPAVRVLYAARLDVRRFVWVLTDPMTGDEFAMRLDPVVCRARSRPATATATATWSDRSRPSASSSGAHRRRIPSAGVFSQLKPAAEGSGEVPGSLAGEANKSQACHRSTDLACGHSRWHGSGTLINFDLPQADLALLAGLSSGSVDNAISTLRMRRLVWTGYRRIAVVHRHRGAPS